jgi:hypothetical protein
VSSSDTPLSDLIFESKRNNTDQNFIRFVEAFRRSMVGVVALGIPDDAVGTFVTTVEHPVGLGKTAHGGRPRILAFADPPAFARKFGQQFNAEVSGEVVFATVLRTPESEGILVNSAKEKLSVVIDRRLIQSLRYPASGTNLTVTKPWWKFWWCLPWLCRASDVVRQALDQLDERP